MASHPVYQHRKANKSGLFQKKKEKSPLINPRKLPFSFRALFFVLRHVGAVGERLVITQQIGADNNRRFLYQIIKRETPYLSYRRTPNACVIGPDLKGTDTER